MNIELQKNRIAEIALSRIPPGYENELDLMDIVKENLDPSISLTDNIHMLEEEGILPRKADYLEKKYLWEQKDQEDEEIQLEKDRIIKMMNRRYGIKPVNGRPVKKK